MKSLVAALVVLGFVGCDDKPSPPAGGGGADKLAFELYPQCGATLPAGAKPDKAHDTADDVQSWKQP